MSFQSELLCAEDQNYLLDHVDLNLFQEISNEETLSMNELENYKNQPIKIENSPTILSNEAFDGLYDFQVDIIPNGAKNAWVYSQLLNKVYMDMKSPFPVDFRVKQRPEYPLFIRITPNFSSPQYAQECIYRCPNHESIDASSEQFRLIKPHVLRCHNPNTHYLGEKEKKERLCLFIPFSFPQTGTDNVREMFEFVCKNSCSPGMNRRPVEIIFTLENEMGEILGRKSLNVRICSCPKRDKEKDEKDNAGKPPQGKKRKIQDKPAKKLVTSNQDFKESTLIVPVVGKHNIDKILSYCQDLYSGEIIRYGNTAEAVPFKAALAKINAIIKERTQ